MLVSAVIHAASGVHMTVWTAHSILLIPLMLILFLLFTAGVGLLALPEASTWFLSSAFSESGSLVGLGLVLYAIGRLARGSLRAPGSSQKTSLSSYLPGRSQENDGQAASAR